MGNRVVGLTSLPSTILLGEDLGLYRFCIEIMELFHKRLKHPRKE